MNSTSSANGAGSRTRSSRGVSVVPRMVLPSQGTANSTRPSSVLGTSSACVPGRKARSTTRCTPWLGATIAGLRAAPRRRGPCRAPSSTHTPVALTTQRRAHRQRRRRSRRRARSGRAPCRPRAATRVTAQWFSTSAPRAAAVRASSTARRASSNWPSQYFTPPHQAARRTVGQQLAASRRVTATRWRPGPARPASASYIFSPTP